MIPFASVLNDRQKKKFKGLVESHKESLIKSAGRKNLRPVERQQLIIDIADWTVIGVFVDKSVKGWSFVEKSVKKEGGKVE